MATAHAPLIFEPAAHEAHIWVREIQDEFGWDDPQYALKALRGVLHALRDRLSVEQAAHLAAQLPLMIRGIFYEGWVPERTPSHDRHLDEYLSRVAREFGGYRDFGDLESVARGVLAVLARHVSLGVVNRIMATLPPEIRELWIP